MAGRKLPFHRSFTKDFSAEEKRSPGFGIRADNGGDSYFLFFRFDCSCRVKSLKHTFFFPGYFLSGSDSGQDMLFRGRYRLGWLGSLLALSAESRTILRRKFVVPPDSGSGLILGESVSVVKSR